MFHPTWRSAAASGLPDFSSSGLWVRPGTPLPGVWLRDGHMTAVLAVNTLSRLNSNNFGAFQDPSSHWANKTEGKGW